MNFKIKLDYFSPSNKYICEDSEESDNKHKGGALKLNFMLRES